MRLFSRAAFVGNFASFAGWSACSRQRLPRIAGLVAAGLVLGACARSQPDYDGYAQVGAPQPVQARKVELEADGVAVQAPPRIRPNPAPDDPSEPFSPNYGPPSDGAPAERQARAPAYRIVSRTTPISDREAHAIIIRAMVEHERRNP